MASKTEICNQSLSHLGIGKEIANFTTEASQEAQACRRFYDQALEATLRDFNWPFATKFAALGLIEEDPTTEWSYSYRYPTDCLKIRRILSGVRNDKRDTRVEYKVGQDDSGLLIYTDMEDAEIEYTLNATDPQFYPSDFTNALAFRLAMYIAPRLTGGDPFKMGDRAAKMYDYEVSRAKATALNEEQETVEAESEFIRARE